jgi:hypothetical protein
MLTPQPEAMSEGSREDLLANTSCSAVAAQHEALRGEIGLNLPFDVAGRLPGRGQRTDVSHNNACVHFQFVDAMMVVPGKRPPSRGKRLQPV